MSTSKGSQSRASESIDEQDEDMMVRVFETLEKPSTAKIDIDPKKKMINGPTCLCVILRMETTSHAQYPTTRTTALVLKFEGSAENFVEIVIKGKRVMTETEDAAKKSAKQKYTYVDFKTVRVNRGNIVNFFNFGMGSGKDGIPFSPGELVYVIGCEGEVDLDVMKEPDGITMVLGEDNMPLVCPKGGYAEKIRFGSMVAPDPPIPFLERKELVNYVMRNLALPSESASEYTPFLIPIESTNKRGISPSECSTAVNQASMMPEQAVQQVETQSEKRQGLFVQGASHFYARRQIDRNKVDMTRIYYRGEKGKMFGIVQPLLWSALAPTIFGDHAKGDLVLAYRRGGTDGLQENFEQAKKAAEENPIECPSRAIYASVDSVIWDFAMIRDIGWPITKIYAKVLRQAFQKVWPRVPANDHPFNANASSHVYNICEAGGPNPDDIDDTFDYFLITPQSHALCVEEVAKSFGVNPNGPFDDLFNGTIERWNYKITSKESDPKDKFVVYALKREVTPAKRPKQQTLAEPRKKRRTRRTQN